MVRVAGSAFRLAEEQPPRAVPTLRGHREILPTRAGARNVGGLGLAGKRTGGKSGLSMAFKRIMERANVRGEAVHERAGEAGRTVNTLSFHGFRHTLTSLMANAGVPVEVQQKFTGYASPEMKAHYAHHEIETLRSAIGKLPTLRP